MHRLLKNAYSFLSVRERRSLSFCTTRPILLFFVSITVCFPLAYIPLGAVISAAFGVHGQRSPSFAMNDSKTRRSPHKGIESHQKISIFSESSQLYGVAPDESTETGRQQRESFTKPKWKNYDFIMFWSRIITSRYIAVK